MNKIKRVLSFFMFLCLFTGMWTAIPSMAATGTVYYVAADGKDGNDGFSPEKPLSYMGARSTLLNGGDTMVFKRGDVFYGTFSPVILNTSKDKRVTIGSYGKGELPRISCVKIINNKWTKDSNGFYKYNIIMGNYDGVQSDETNIGFMEDKNGKKWGVRRENASKCTGSYDFYCDDTYIYVKSSSDPYSALGVLTLGINDPILQVSSYMNVRELNLQYTGGHGIVQKSKSEYVTISDCVISDIGGARLGNTGFTKYGNAIEFYGSANNNTVERCIIRNCYDVGYTLQGDGAWSGMVVKNNIFAYSTQAFELWTVDKPNNGVNGCDFIGNICINQGEGWGTLARPDVFGGQGQVTRTDILIYGYPAPILKVNVSGNIFYNRNEENRIYSASSYGIAFFQKASINNNHLYFPSTTSICASTDRTSGQYGNIDLTFKQWQEKYGHDKNSTFTEISNKGSKYAKLESLAMTSNNFSEILSAINAAGIKINITVPPSKALPGASSISSTTSGKKTRSTAVSNKISEATSSSIPTTTTTESESETTYTSENLGTTTTVSKDNASDEVEYYYKLTTAGLVAIIIGAIVLLAGAGVVIYIFVIKKNLLSR